MWPVPWSPGLGGGAIQILATFPLLPILLNICGMDVTCPFLPCSGDQGARRQHFLLCFLLSDDTLKVAGKQWLRKMDKMSCKMNAHLLDFTLWILVHLPLIPLQRKISISFLIPFHLWLLHNTASKTKQEKKHPKFIFGHIIFYHKPSIQLKHGCRVLIWGHNWKYTESRVIQWLFSPRRQ